MTTLTWIRCTDNRWCSFANLKLDSIQDFGVYIIWLGQSNIYVGQGDIAERIQTHRNDERFQQYDVNSMLVTWATTPLHERDGIERYLADTLRPIIGKQWPNVIPIPVNLSGS